jgi:prevent-host-death family protein
MSATIIFNIHDAKTHFSKILHRIEAGEEIIIAKAGKPVAKVIPFKATKHQRIFGLLKGKMKIPPNFDAPLPKKLLKVFYEG